MEHENFKERFGADVRVCVNEINKLNESYEAITVTRQGGNVGVNIEIPLKGLFIDLETVYRSYVLWS